MTVIGMRRAIASRFPVEAADADDFLAQRDHDVDAHHVWLERFSDLTTQAMAARDEPLVRAHLAFMSQQLRSADSDVRKIIDVAYVENLMSGLKADARRWAWPMIPPNLKKLFIDFWGEPDV